VSISSRTLDKFAISIGFSAMALKLALVTSFVMSLDYWRGMFFPTLPGAYGFLLALSSKVAQGMFGTCKSFEPILSGLLQQFGDGPE